MGNDEGSGGSHPRSSGRRSGNGGESVWVRVMERVWYGESSWLLRSAHEMRNGDHFTRAKAVNTLTPNHTRSPSPTYNMRCEAKELRLQLRSIYILHILYRIAAHGKEGEGFHLTTHCMQCMHPPFSLAFGDGGLG